jgi:hypothetical protein
MKSKILIPFLAIGALIGLYVGGGLLFFPVELQSGNGIALPTASHFSETRAPGAAIFVASIIAVLSLFWASLRKTALTLLALFFSSYGLARLISLVLDGIPAPGLYYAMYGELLMGGIAIILLLQWRYTDPT